MIAPASLLLTLASRSPATGTAPGLLLAALIVSLAGPAAAAPPTARTLREAAGNRFVVGCALATQDLNNAKLADLVAEQFGAVTPEYEMFPQFITKKQSGEFDFGPTDRVVDFALSHHMAVYGHMLLWHLFTPQGMFQDDKKRPLPREHGLANLRRHIQGVMTHYKGKIKAYAVVNEALSDDAKEYLRDTPARRCIGDDYIEKAFEFAHEADPDAMLYYNDYNAEQPDKRKKILRLVGELRAKGLRIDAVGIQGHWLIDSPSTEIIADGIKAFGDAGLKVMITELDVDVLPRTVSGANLQIVETGPNPYPDGLPDEMQQKLARRYEAIFQTLLRFPVIIAVSFWGVADNRSWLNDFPVKNRTNYPLLFDRQYQPKPAFESVTHVLDQNR